MRCQESFVARALFLRGEKHGVGSVDGHAAGDSCLVGVDIVLTNSHERAGCPFDVAVGKEDVLAPVFMVRAVLQAAGAGVEIGGNRERRV